LTNDDWNELEEIFWHEVGTKEDYACEVGSDMPLGRFVRAITGLSQEAALAAFSEFLDGHCYTEEQIRFVHCVIDWIVNYGTLEAEDMRNDEFSGGIDFVNAFENNSATLRAIIGKIQHINENAVRKVA
jgi:type I restriction enzyme R subunit